MNYLVSVILPTYNGVERGYLKEAITSVLQQSYPNYELIIVNDGSTDTTGQFCFQYADNDKINYIEQENKGLASARNTGIRNSNGDFICFLDDDDLWKKDKLRKQVDFFSACSDDSVGMIYTAAEYINEESKVIGVRYTAACGNIHRRLIYKGNIITCPSAVMIKRAVLDKVGLINETMKSLEDFELWLRIARNFSIYSTAERLVFYRLHTNRITVQSYRREEKYEKILYDNFLQADESLDKRTIYRNLYQRFAVRHFSLGNLGEARKSLKRAAAYGLPSLYITILFVISYCPGCFKILLRLRRRLKLLLSQSN